MELQLETLEHIRRQAAVRMGLVRTTAEAARAIPKLAIVAAPAQSDPDCDVNVMMLSMGKPHPALAITGSIALTLAARTPGTVLNSITGDTLAAHAAAPHPRRGDRDLERGARRDPCWSASTERPAPSPPPSSTSPRPSAAPSKPP